MSSHVFGAVRQQSMSSPSPHPLQPPLFPSLNLILTINWNILRRFVGFMFPEGNVSFVYGGESVRTDLRKCWSNYYIILFYLQYGCINESEVFFKPFEVYFLR